MFVYIKFVIVGLPFLPVAVTLNSSRKTVKMTLGAFLNLIRVVMGKVCPTYSRVTMFKVFTT